MTSFHEVRFPDNIAYGATGGPEFPTRLWRPSGAREAQRQLVGARGRWDVASGLTTRCKSMS